MNQDRRKTLEQFIAASERYAGLGLSDEELSAFIRSALDNYDFLEELETVAPAENAEPNSYLNLLASMKKNRK
jgi:hypothetical protein